MPFSRHVLLLSTLLFLSLTATTVLADDSEPNVGLLRIHYFRTPAAVAPSSVFAFSINVEYALHGNPDNATIRTAIYSGAITYTEPIWRSNELIVHGGGDVNFDGKLTAPPTEGYMQVTAYAFFLDQGRWHFYNDTNNGPGFIQATVKIAKVAGLSVKLGVSKLPVSVGGATVDTSSSGQAQTTLPVGATYEVSVPSTFQFQNSTRVVFLGWDDGNNATDRVVTLDGDVTLVGSYKTQYMLRVNSPVASYSEWYDAGTVIQLQSPASLETNGPLGLFGAKSNFIGWRGDVQSQSLQVNVTMNAPKVIEASYSINMTPLAVPTIIAAGVAGAFVLFVFLRRRRMGLAKEAPPIEPSGKNCVYCGKDIEEEWTYCIHCGKSLTVESAGPS